MQGLWALVWLEIKIFIREPLGVVGSVVVPVILFVVASRLVTPATASTASTDDLAFVATDLPVFVSVLIALSAVLSLVTIIAIYREGRHPQATPGHAVAPPRPSWSRTCS